MVLYRKIAKLGPRNFVELLAFRLFQALRASGCHVGSLCSARNPRKDVTATGKLNQQSPAADIN